MISRALNPPRSCRGVNLNTGLPLPLLVASCTLDRDGLLVRQPLWLASDFSAYHDQQRPDGELEDRLMRFAASDIELPQH